MDKEELVKKFADGTPMESDEIFYLAFLGIVHEKSPGWWQFTNYGREMLSSKAS